MVFFVIELQSNGTEGNAIPFAFADKSDALAKAYSLASVAVKSDVEKHSIMCVNSFGFNVIDPMVFEHEPKAQNTKKTSAK